MLLRLLKRWADVQARMAIDRLQGSLDEMKTQIKERDSIIRIQTLEINQLVAVVVRNHKRIAAETADFAQKIVGAENGENGHVVGFDSQGVRRR